MVTLYYRPLTWMEWLEAHPNKGVLIGSSSVTSRRVRSAPKTAGNLSTGYSLGSWQFVMPLYGNGADFTWGSLYGGVTNATQMVSVEGQDMADKTGRLRWAVTQGSPIQFLGRTVYEVFSIISKPDVFYYQYAPRVGCYNNLEMTSFPLAPSASRIGQWLLIGLSFAPRLSKNRLWNYRARFALSLDAQGWAEPVVSKQLEVQTQVVDQWAMDETVNPPRRVNVGKRTVRVLVPTGKQNVTHLIQPANFSPINAMLENSWSAGD